MAARPNVTPLWEEATFQEEGLDARALVTRTDKNGNIINEPSIIDGYVAVRREPTREEVSQAEKLYKAMRKAELLEKLHLKDWEKELLKRL